MYSTSKYESVFGNSTQVVGFKKSDGSRVWLFSAQKKI